MVFNSSFDYVATFPTLLSIIATLMCCHVVSPMLSSKFVSSYKSVQRKAYWNTLLGSTVHAFIVIVLVLVIHGGGYIDDYVVSKSALGFFTLQLSLGYFVGDIAVVLASSQLRKDIGTIAHHISSLLGIFLSLYYEGHLMYFPVFRLFAELSTPFVNLRWWLQETNTPKSSRWFILAAVGMTVTFFSTRILPIPWQWYITIGTVTDEACYVIPLKFRVFLCLANLVFDLLNLYWMYKIGRGILKFIHTIQRSKKT